MFLMSGSLVTAAHTMAHAQLSDEILADIAYEKAHEHGAHEDSSDHDGSSQHHKPSDHKGDHGAELHFTALDVMQPALDPPSLPAALKAFYSDKQHPAPLLPPDPDPDRA